MENNEFKKLKWFRVGEKTPITATYIKSKTQIDREYSNHGWCGCHDMINCNCYTEEETDFHLYEILQIN